MFKKQKTLFLALVITLMGMIPLHAEVERVDVYFLSRPTSAFKIPKDGSLLKGLYTENSFDENCVPMGDGCFHPQYGYVEKEGQTKEANKVKDTKEIKLKTINSEEVDLVNCDDEFYFDLYCGKEKKIKETKKEANEFEIWIDTSSSMRLVDYSSDDAYCDRRRLVASLKSQCKKNIEMSVFNTAKKRLSTLDNLCINHGTNDGDRMVSWLKQTQTKHVVIITDMEEYIGAFREYLDSISANIHGIGIDPLLASDLIKKEKDFLQYCQ